MPQVPGKGACAAVSTSAEALADDLDRWLSGEPIAARPVGQVERLALWCRRNPVVSSLTTTVAVSLLIGILASTFFAFKERRERARAEVAEKKALDARDGMEGMLARGFARPLDPDGGRKTTLSQPEADSLWELSRLANTDVGLRFIEEATLEPSLLNRLGARAEPAPIAAVGLDETKRDRATQLLGRRCATRHDLPSPEHSRHSSRSN